MIDQNSKRSLEPSMFSFFNDLPNICSLAGLGCALLGIYFAVLGNFHFALIGVLWATLFDWGDGIIARNIKGRTEIQGAFGANLDSLIDIVSFGVFPAVFLLSYGEFNPLFLPGAFILIAVSTIRLSYFNIYGMIDKKTYRGLAIDNNVIILAFLFLFEGLFTHTLFSIILYVVLMIMPILNLASIRTYKFDGKWVYVLIGYVIGMTVIYCCIN
ncbi:MAG: CDP-alcohol phosphatidyltransferase family protein [Vallitaleaceae bacterium]|jgi:phosphatidylserine synthase|nr:CDP-alcohol phosphatidyltransferase family protein [Vallitaleaceae bacterium]